MSLRFRPFLACLAVVVALSSASISAAQTVADEIAAILADRVEATATDTFSTSLTAETFVPRFYDKRGFQPAWSTPEHVASLFEELNAGLAHGFRASDFRLSELQDLAEAARTGSAADQAVFDIVATDAAVTLVHHLFFGKVDPAALDDDWNFAKPVIKRDPAVVLNQYLDGEGFSALMELIDIPAPQYKRLVQALATYRAIADKGGWPQVPDDVVLKPDMVEPAVALLRQRLAAEGALTASVAAPAEGTDVDPAWIYDAALVDDVKAFQARHGLEADGVVGAKTFASLNQPVQDRIDKLRLSLERGRWLLRDLEDEFVLVNIAGARTYLIKSDDTIWTTRSITGSAFRKTPVFRDEIKYMEFNPTWTVPSSILRKDKLSRIRRDVRYLARNNFIVRNRNGQQVAANLVNWGASNPPVTLVQAPGPDNALGLVKFMFPNKYSVYLHDTNDRSLFSRNERNLSSGCVRVEYPFEFANLLMEADPEWSQARMQAILDSGRTTRVDLPKPIPVLLTYWTAWVEDGAVHFREDPYERDPPILQALNR